MQKFNSATITAFGQGKDNAYKNNPDGGDRVARTRDPKRNHGHAAHAVLGSGVFHYPTSLSVKPDSGIPFGSMVYVYGMGWFVVEDVMAGGFAGPRFDMWSGPSESHEMSALSGKMDVVVYSNPDNVPRELQALGPSPKWTAHFNKMRDRIRTQKLTLFVAP
jgi:3D (Asp-Asp-Asp) domain-containing protein